jgi:hypothetical protein
MRPWMSTAGLLVLCLSVTRCQTTGGTTTGGGGEGGSSSSSSSGSFATFLEACNSWIDTFCNTGTGMGCDGGTANREACLQAEQHRCGTQNESVVAQIDAGLVTYNPTAAGECLEAQLEFYASYSEAACAGDPMAFWRLFYPSYTCSNGVPVFDDGVVFDIPACRDFLVGNVAASDACGNDEVCQSGACSGDGDGGCGTCAADAGSTALGERGQGQSCVTRFDGGNSTVYPCASGFTCDQGGSDTCIPWTGANAACGQGVGKCAPGCGYRCAISGGATTGTCTALAAENAACSNAEGCAKGLSCVVYNGPDAGSPKCAPHAEAGETCGLGVNYDQWGEFLPDYAGGYGNNAPACAVGFVCEVTPGALTGTCRAAAARANGEACAFGDTCSDSQARCHTTDAGQVCALPTTCNGNYDCPNAVCERADAGPGSCVPKRSLGQACNENNECADLYTQCFEGTCQKVVDIDPPEVPICE